MHSCKMLSYMYSVRACLGRQGNSGYQLFIYYPVNSNTDALKEDKDRTRCKVIPPIQISLRKYISLYWVVSLPCALTFLVII